MKSREICEHKDIHGSVIDNGFPISGLPGLLFMFVGFIRTQPMTASGSSLAVSLLLLGLGGGVPALAWATFMLQYRSIHEGASLPRNGVRANLTDG